MDRSIPRGRSRLTELSIYVHKHAVGVANEVISNAVDESGVMTKTMLVRACHCLSLFDKMSGKNTSRKPSYTKNDALRILESANSSDSDDTEIGDSRLMMAVIVTELVYIEDSDSDDSTATLAYNQTYILAIVQTALDVDLYHH